MCVCMNVGMNERMNVCMRTLARALVCMSACVHISARFCEAVEFDRGLGKQAATIPGWKPQKP